MKHAIALLFLVSTFSSLQAHALDVYDFTGSWKEVGFRCAGEKAFQPRPFTARKMLTLNGFDYSHRVEFDDVTWCTSVASSGSIISEYVGGSNWLGLHFKPQESSECSDGSGTTIVDDFMLNADPMIWVSKEEIQGETYLILGGDDQHMDPRCDHLYIERVYASH